MLLVQILKAPTSTKGPRLTCEITIPGRLLVLVPFSNIVTISKKINDSDERKRLRVLIESIKPANFGVILRTAAQDKKDADLHEELIVQLVKWMIMHEHQDIQKIIGQILRYIVIQVSLL